MSKSARETSKERFAFLQRLTRLGVDRSLPRHETKHIVLTNQYVLFLLCWLVGCFIAPTFKTLLPEVRTALGLAMGATVVTLLLNARGFPAAATTWLLATNTLIYVRLGTLEPLETEHAGFLLLNSAIAWFSYSPRHRMAALIASLASSAAIVWLLRYLFTHEPPPPLPGFDAHVVGLWNRLIVHGTVVFLCYRAVDEVARVERQLVDERTKTERLLKREVAHQVAQRSRELGAALDRTGDERPVAQLGAARFGDRYRVLRPLGEGGMGAVYEVERITDGVRLALKVMTGPISRVQALRFAREAEIGARVEHENVVPIVDVGVDDSGAPFLLMELASGARSRRSAHASASDAGRSRSFAISRAAYTPCIEPASYTATSSRRTFCSMSTAARSSRTSVSRALVQRPSPSWIPRRRRRKPRRRRAAR